MFCNNKKEISPPCKSSIQLLIKIPMQATKKQKQLIHVNAPTRDIKEEFVQWATGDVNKISTNDLNFEQANRILEKLGKQPIRAKKEDSPLFWGYFDKNNSQHMQIQSLLHQLHWTVEHP